MAEQSFSLIVEHARGKRPILDERLTVNGTLIEAWAGQKSFQRKHGQTGRGGNPTLNWHEEKTSTH